MESFYMEDSLDSRIYNDLVKGELFRTLKEKINKNGLPNGLPDGCPHGYSTGKTTDIDGNTVPDPNVCEWTGSTFPCNTNNNYKTRPEGDITSQNDYEKCINFENSSGTTKTGNERLKP